MVSCYLFAATTKYDDEALRTQKERLHVTKAGQAIMVARLLFILALLHAKTDAVLEIARPRQPQPIAIRIAPPDRPTTDTRGGAVAAWHAERKNAITKKLGADVIARLEAPTPARTLSCLVAADALIIGLATYTQHLD